MNNPIKNLMEAQKYAMSIRPQVGGFPVLAEVLRRAGAKMNRWHLPSCQSIYFMNDGNVVQQSTPLVTGTYEVPQFNREALIAAIRADQEGKSTFPEFLQATWNAGVVSYDADFINRVVTYYGVNGESYAENYPMVEINLKP